MTAPEQLVTDGGLETDLIFHHGVDLPDFAAFPLLGEDRGRGPADRLLRGVRRASPSGPASGCCSRPRPGGRTPTGPPASGTTPPRWPRSTATPSAFLRALGERWSDRLPSTRVSGQVGPRGDGYRPGAAVDPDEAAAYHRPQIAAFAEAGADLATALTLTDVGEALGVVAAAQDVGLPVAISFTVETDGRLPGGTTLAEAIGTVDAAGGPAYFLVNCAHPDHVERGLGEDGPWRERIHGLRVNASTLSHEELDEATELDDGDPAALAPRPRRLERLAAGGPHRRRLLRHRRPPRRRALARPRRRRPDPLLACAGDRDPAHRTPHRPPGLVGRRGHHGRAGRRRRLPVLDRRAARAAGERVRLVPRHHLGRGQPQPGRSTASPRRSPPR